MTNILTKYQYNYQVSVYWYLYLVFRFPNTDTSYFKNVLQYWYFQYFSLSVFLKNRNEIIAWFPSLGLTLLHYSWLLYLVIFINVTPFHLAALIGHLWLWQRLLGSLLCNDKWNKFAHNGSPNLALHLYTIISTKKYLYWILILQYFLDTDTASVFFRLYTDTDTSVF